MAAPRLDRAAGVAHPRGMLRGALIVGLWTMASRVLGFARDVLIAAFLGAGPVADAFFVALKLPNLFRRLFGEGAFNAAFVPSFSGLLSTEGQAEAQGFAEETLGVMVFWLALLSVLGEIFMPWVIAAVAPGFAEIPAKYALAVNLTRITFPYLFLICLAALVSGALNGLDRFAAAAAAPVLFNIVLIAALLGLTPLLPNAGYALSVGVTVSGVLQLAMLLFALRRAGMVLRVPRPRLSPRIRALLRRIAPGLLGAGATQLNLAVDVIIASLLPPGTVSILYYADRVTQLPLGTIGVALGTALLPLLSRQLRAAEAAQANHTLNRALEYGLFLSLPAAGALIVCAWPVMFVLFGRGAFDAENVRLSSQALMAYAVGLPAYIGVKALAPGMFARGDTATPMKIGLATVAVNLALNIAFMVPLRHMGPAFATSLASLFNAAALWFVLSRRGHFSVDATLRRRAPRIALAVGMMAIVLVIAERWLFADPAVERGLKWVYLTILVVLGMAAYAVAGQVLRAFDLREATRILARKQA